RASSTRWSRSATPRPSPAEAPPISRLLLALGRRLLQRAAVDAGGDVLVGLADGGPARLLGRHARGDLLLVVAGQIEAAPAQELAARLPAGLLTVLGGLLGAGLRAAVDPGGGASGHERLGLVAERRRIDLGAGHRHLDRRGLEQRVRRGERRVDGA